MHRAYRRRTSSCHSRTRRFCASWVRDRIRGHTPLREAVAHLRGGALYNKGCHPLGVALYLKAQEGVRKGIGPIRPQSVVASVANLTHLESFVREADKWIQEGWVDCEDWGAMVVTFDDGTVAQISAADITLGGIHSVITVYASKAVVQCNINPSTGVLCYAPAPEVFGEAYVREKVETKAGWHFANPDEDWANGSRPRCRISARRSP